MAFCHIRYDVSKQTSKKIDFTVDSYAGAIAPIIIYLLLNGEKNWLNSLSSVEIIKI